MKLYTAGLFNTIPVHKVDEFLAMTGVYPFPILESYHYRRSVERAVEYGVRDLFLDSGAFSAFASGAKIDLAGYIKDIQRVLSAFSVVAALDAIGDVDKTWRNIRTMEDAGLRPLPVFHYGSPFEALDLCKEYDYFALGGLVPIAAQRTKLLRWLDRCWERITTVDGRATHRVHGFGMTGLEVMARYPWYSVDSTSWLRGGQGGAVLVPGTSGEVSRTIVIADNSPRVHEWGSHYTTLTPLEREHLREYIEVSGMFTIEQLTRDHYARRAFNIRESVLWAERLGPRTFQRTEMELFNA